MSVMDFFVAGSHAGLTIICRRLLSTAAVRMPGGSFNVSLAILSAAAVSFSNTCAVSCSAASSICGAFGFFAIESARIAGTISQPASPAISFQPSAPLKMTCQSGFCLAMMLASGSITSAASTRLASSWARATAKLALTTTMSLPRSMPLAAVYIFTTWYCEPPMSMASCLPLRSASDLMDLSLAKMTRSASVKPVPMMRTGTPCSASFWNTVGPPISASVSPVAKPA
jgi:hypothetical protein